MLTTISLQSLEMLFLIIQSTSLPLIEQDQPAISINNRQTGHVYVLLIGYFCAVNIAV